MHLDETLKSCAYDVQPAETFRFVCVEVYREWLAAAISMELDQARARHPHDKQMPVVGVSLRNRALREHNYFNGSQAGV